MKGNRDKINGETMPETEVINLSKNEFQVRYNFTEVAGNDERSDSYNYDYVNVKKLTKKEVKKAIIKTKYDYDDEIGAINNSDADYQSFRGKADEVAVMIQ